MTDLDAQVRYAKLLSESSLIPKHLRGNPANVLLYLALAEAQDVKPAVAFGGFQVIGDTPSMKPEMMRAQIQRHGHTLTYRENSADRCVLHGKRIDNGSELEVVWDIDKARKAGLDPGKGTWAKYPAAMLSARATAELARALFSDCLNGISYTPEELGAEVDEDGAAEHRSLVRDVLDDDKKADRQGRKKKSDPTPPPVDDWSTTDPKWLAEWREALADATNDDVIDALGADLMAAIATGQVVQADVEILKAEGKSRREQLKTEPGPGQVDMLTAEVVDPPAEGWPQVQQPPDAEAVA